MSQYIQFFIKHNNEFIPVGTYGRSHAVFQIARVPFEGISAVTGSDLDAWVADAKIRIAEYNEQIAREKSVLEVILRATSSFRDKVEYIQKTKATIQDIEELIKITQSAIDYYNFLHDLIDEAVYGIDANPDEYLYGGVEVGRPTVKDTL